VELEKKAVVSKALTLFSELKGEYVWFVRVGADNILRMDFGSPHLTIREPIQQVPNSAQAAIDALERRMVIPTGKWHLFIEDGNWSVRTKHYVTDRRDQNAKTVEATLRHLDGQKLVSVDYVDNSDAWHFLFDLGGSLRIEPSSSLEENGSAEECQWTLFYADGNYVSYISGKELRYKNK